MDILLRNVDAKVISIVDEKAKEKGISRNQLLKEYINLYVTNEGYKSKTDSIDYTISKLSNAFEFNQKRMESIEHNLENILLLISISAGIDIQDIPMIIKQYKQMEVE